MQLKKFPIRTRILTLLALGSLLVGLDRAGLGPAVEAVRDALQVPSPALDISFGAYSFGFFVALALGGVLTHRWGAARTLMLCALVAAVAMVATAGMIHVAGVAFCRLILGLAAGAMLPAGTILLAEWVPQQERGWALALVHGAYWLGPLLASGIVASSEWVGSWRGAFLLLGIATGVWCLLWREAGPEQSPPPERPPIYWRGHLIRFRLPLCLAFAQSWAIALVIAWVPAYQLASWHLNIASSSILTLIVAATTTGGVMAGGFACDWILADSGNIRPARQLLPSIGFFGAALGALAIPGYHDLDGIILSTGVTLFFLSLATAPLWSLALDVSAADPAVGTFFIGLGMGLGQLLAPLTLTRLSGFWWLAPALALPMMLAAAVGAFQLRPDLGIPDPPLPAVDDADGAKPER